MVGLLCLRRSGISVAVAAAAEGPGGSLRPRGLAKLPFGSRVFWSKSLGLLALTVISSADKISFSSSLLIFMLC